MDLQRRIGVSLLLTVLVGFSATSVLADSRQSRVPLRNRPFQFPNIHPDPDDACRNLSGGAFLLCDSFCNILRCNIRSSPLCDVVRWKWMHLTFRSTFPCEEVAPPPTATSTPGVTGTPTGTASATVTPGEGEPTGTPTETGTVGATPTEDATANPTPTDTGPPGDTPTATATEDDATPTETVTGTPTGTVAATITPTGTAPTATSTTAPSLTPTATGTTQISPSFTPEPTATITPLPTDTPQNTATPTATDTPGAPECPVSAGNYTLTQIAGGSLTVDGLPAFPFPAGGVITQTVAAGTPADLRARDRGCRSRAASVAPVFCIPALGFTHQRRADRAAVSAVSTRTAGRTSRSRRSVTPARRRLLAVYPRSCAPGANSNVRVDVTVGDGRARHLRLRARPTRRVSVPVFTTTWLKIASVPGPGRHVQSRVRTP